MSRRLGRPPRIEGQDTTTLILEEAERQFSAAGYAVTTSKTVASGCGLTGPALYHYFANKTELYAAVADRGYGPMLDGFKQILGSVSGFRARLNGILEASIELHQQRPSLAGFVMGGPIEARRHPELRPIIDHHYAMLRAQIRQLVDEAKDDNEIRSSTATEDVIDLILSVLHGFAHQAYQDNSAERHASIVRTFERLLDGAL